MPPEAGAVGADILASAISQVAIAAGRDDTLPALTGIRMEIAGETVTLVATDRYRLAVRELHWEPAKPDMAAAVLVPARVLVDAARSLTTAAEVSIALSVPGDDGSQGEGRRIRSRPPSPPSKTIASFSTPAVTASKLLLGASSVSITDPQIKMINMLAGGSSDETHEQMSQDLLRILEAQRIVSLDTLFQLADHIDAIAKGGKLDPKLVNQLASRISEIQLPRASLSANEKNAMGFGFWTEKHIDAERRLNLRASIEKAAGAPERVQETRGLLTPLLRDTLLAYNYAHYAPPGAQILYTNPVFVRSHDFLGMQGTDHTWRTTELYGTGWPSNGGGRLVGSLSALPYALAEAEQNFLIPTQTQALIWGDLVPQMILSAKIPRWWHTSPELLHWTGLHLRYGRELVAEASLDKGLRTDVVAAIGVLAAPARTRQVATLLEQGDVREALDRVTPSELFLVAREVGAKRNADSSCLLAEMKQMESASPKELTYAAVSRAFGTPKPTLANSYEPELLNLRTFPTLMGYSSRIMAESWESNTLYWAALADELSVAPQQLNVRIPEWTRRLVEQIFASHLEDWPAVLKSLRTIGDDVRAHARATQRRQPKQLCSEYNLSGNSRHDDHSPWLFRYGRRRSYSTSRPGCTPHRVPRQSGHGGAELPGHRQ